MIKCTCSFASRFCQLLFCTVSCGGWCWAGGNRHWIIRLLDIVVFVSGCVISQMILPTNMECLADFFWFSSKRNEWFFKNVCLIKTASLIVKLVVSYQLYAWTQEICRHRLWACSVQVWPLISGEVLIWNYNLSVVFGEININWLLVGVGTFHTLHALAGLSIFSLWSKAALLCHRNGFNISSVWKVWLWKAKVFSFHVLADNDLLKFNCWLHKLPIELQSHLSCIFYSGCRFWSRITEKTLQ